MINYEKIKRMSIEDMAHLIFDLGNGREYGCVHCAYQGDDECPNDGSDGCLSGVRKWLEKEISE